MKTKQLIRVAALAMASSFIRHHPSLLHAASLGTAFTYEGHLSEGGQSANATYDFKFTLYNAETGPDTIAGPLTNSVLAVSKGLFTTTLDFGAAFDGNPRWLEIGVRPAGAASDFTTLSPRQRLTPTPYALYAPNAGAATTAAVATAASSVAAGAVGTAALQPGAVDSSKIAGAAVGLSQLSPAVLSNTFWRLDGNSGTVAGTQFLGTSDNQPLELQVNHQRALRLEPNASGAPNMIGGAPNNLVNGDIVGAVIGGGGTTNYYGSVFFNQIAADFGVIGGGYQNTIADNSLAGAIAGGVGNDIGASSYYSAVGGGRNNNIGDYSYYSTIAGGMVNDIGNNSTYGTIAGGSGNRIQTNAAYSSIGGGANNAIQPASQWSTIAGGTENVIGTNCSRATIGGGVQNTIQSASYATIGGGAVNTIQTNATHSVIAGGVWNTNTGPYAMIPGGRENSAAKYGFAAGRRAKASHEGTFVWADSTNADFSSTTSNQFNVRASGGVRFETAGAGLTIDGAAVLAGSIQAGQIASDAVTGATIQDGSVTAADVNAATFGQTFWKTDGNAGTTPGTHFIGTTDNQPLELKVHGLRTLRLELNGGGAPNLIAGSPANFIGPGVVGATIAGGGTTNDWGVAYTNAVQSDFGSVGGGSANVIRSNAPSGTIPGGMWNVISGGYGTIGGGLDNSIASSSCATVAGGYWNDIATNSSYGTIGGGNDNKIAGNSPSSVIAGGLGNNIGPNSQYSTIGGGIANEVSTNSQCATIPGGMYNKAASYAFAAGYRAKAIHAGAFVWADAQSADFTSTAASQFLIRASGGVGIGTTSPQCPLDVSGSGNLNYSYGYLNSAGNIGTAVGVNPYSIRAASRICALEFNAYSDSRSKQVVRRSRTSEDLETIRRLEVTDYRFIDTIGNGPQIKKGFIAQEVEQIIPEAVTSSPNFIPQPFCPAARAEYNSELKALTVTLPKPHELAVGDEVRLYVGREMVERRVTQVPSETQFVVGEWSSPVETVFVYGRYVNDYKTLDYNRLFTTGLGAIQELAKQLEAKENRIAQLEATVARMAATERETAELRRLVDKLSAGTNGGIK